MKKLKMAIGFTGKCVFLEKFPNDEEHQGLEGHLELIQDDCEFNEEPGIYEVGFQWVSNKDYYNYEPSDDYLDVFDLKKVK